MNHTHQNSENKFSEKRILTNNCDCKSDVSDEINIQSQDELPVDLLVLKETSNINFIEPIEESDKIIENAESQKISDENRLSTEVDIFISYLYSIVSMPMKNVLSLILNFQSFYNINFGQKLSNYNKNSCKDEYISRTLNVMKSIFQNYDTTYKTLKALKNLHYIEPLVINVATVLHSKRVSRVRKKYTQIKVSVAMIPMALVLKKFSELPNVFPSIKKHIKTMEDCVCMCSIYKSERWNEIKARFVGKIVLPLIVYGDDFEVNNPLGSHSNVNKEHGLYLSIAGLPPEYASQLENIFLFQIFESSYKKITDMTKLYNPVIKQLRDLQQTGIEVTIKGKIQKVYFDLFNFSGDNLELHNVLGFNECFNSTYSCRLCYMTKRECQGAIKEGSSKMRTAEKHYDDLCSKKKVLSRNRSSRTYRGLIFFVIFRTT